MSELTFGTEEMYFMGSNQELREIVREYAPLEIRNRSTGKIFTVYSFDGDYFYGEVGEILFDVDTEVQLRGRASIRNQKEKSR